MYRRVQIHGELAEELAESMQDIELVDANGNVVGRFRSAKLQSKYQELIRTTDWDRLEEIAKNPGPGRPLSEILEDLKKRAS